VGSKFVLSQCTHLTDRQTDVNCKTVRVRWITDCTWKRKRIKQQKSQDWLTEDLVEREYRVKVKEVKEDAQKTSNSGTTRKPVRLKNCSQWKPQDTVQDCQRTCRSANVVAVKKDDRWRLPCVISPNLVNLCSDT